MPIDFNAHVNINTGNLGDNPRNSLRMSSNMRKRMRIGKAWAVGDQATVLYPFWWYNEPGEASGFVLHHSGYFGHKVNDIKLLGTGFLRSLSPIDQFGNVIGSGDLAYQFSRIAPLLVNAQKERELAELNAKDWSTVPMPVYQEARQKIEYAYDTKNNPQAKKPLIERLKVEHTTEVVYVPLDPNGGIRELKEAQGGNSGGSSPLANTYNQVLSESRQEKLMSLANDKDYGILAQNPGMVPEAGKLYFLQVRYNWTAASGDKKDAGRAEPQGLSHDYTIHSQHPEFVKRVEELCNNIPVTASGIAAHTYASAPLPDEVLRARLQAVMVTATSSLPYMTQEDKNRFVQNAELIDYLRIVPHEDPDLVARIEEELGHPIGQAPTEEAAPTIASIMSADGNPDFSQQSQDGIGALGNSGSGADADMDLLGGADINLGVGY